MHHYFKFEFKLYITYWLIQHVTSPIQISDNWGKILYPPWIFAWETTYTQSEDTSREEWNIFTHSWLFWQPSQTISRIFPDIQGRAYAKKYFIFLNNPWISKNLRDLPNCDLDCFQMQNCISHMWIAQMRNALWFLFTISSANRGTIASQIKSPSIGV